MYARQPSTTFHEREQRLVYSLDRRGPSESRLASIHTVVLVLIAAVAVALLTFS